MFYLFTVDIYVDHFQFGANKSSVAMNVLQQVLWYTHINIFVGKTLQELLGQNVYTLSVEVLPILFNFLLGILKSKL